MTEYHNEMKITVIPPAFPENRFRQRPPFGKHEHAAATTYVQRPIDDLPRPMMGQVRSDDLDVPTFIRKKAD